MRFTLKTDDLAKLHGQERGVVLRDQADLPAELRHACCVRAAGLEEGLERTVRDPVRRQAPDVAWLPALLLKPRLDLADLHDRDQERRRHDRDDGQRLYL